MEEKEFKKWQEEWLKERDRKRKKKAFTLYLSEEYIAFLKKENVNVSKFVDDSLGRFVTFIKKELQKEKKEGEEDNEKNHS